MPKGNGQNNNEEEKDIETVSVNNSEADEEEEKTEEQIDNEEEIDNDNDDDDGDGNEDENEEEKSEEPQDEDEPLTYEKSYAWRINEWKKDAKANNYADFARSYVIDLITADMICGNDSPEEYEFDRDEFNEQRREVLALDSTMRYLHSLDTLELHDLAENYTEWRDRRDKWEEEQSELEYQREEEAKEKKKEEMTLAEERAEAIKRLHDTYYWDSDINDDISLILAIDHMIEDNGYDPDEVYKKGTLGRTMLSNYQGQIRTTMAFYRMTNMEKNELMPILEDPVLLKECMLYHEKAYAQELVEIAKLNAEINDAEKESFDEIQNELNNIANDSYSYQIDMLRNDIQERPTADPDAEAGEEPKEDDPNAELNRLKEGYAQIIAFALASCKKPGFNQDENDPDDPDDPDPEENLRRDYDLNDPHLDEKCFHELADKLQVQISRSQAYMAMVNNYTKEQFLEAMKDPIKAMNDYVKADKAEYERNPQYYKSEVRRRKSERVIRERRKQEEREFRESRRETAKNLYKEIKERKGPSAYTIDSNRTELNHKINDKRGSMYTPFNIPGVIEDNDALDICKNLYFGSKLKSFGAINLTAAQVTAWYLGVKGNSIDDLKDLTPPQAKQLFEEFKKDVAAHPVNGPEAEKLSPQELEANIRWYAGMHSAARHKADEIKYPSEEEMKTFDGIMNYSKGDINVAGTLRLIFNGNRYLKIDENNPQKVDLSKIYIDEFNKLKYASNAQTDKKDPEQDEAKDDNYFDDVKDRTYTENMFLQTLQKISEAGKSDNLQQRMAWKVLAEGQMIPLLQNTVKDQKTGTESKVQKTLNEGSRYLGVLISQQRSYVNKDTFREFTDDECVEILNTPLDELKKNNRALYSKVVIAIDDKVARAYSSFGKAAHEERVLGSIMKEYEAEDELERRREEYRKEVEERRKQHIELHNRRKKNQQETIDNFNNTLDQAAKDLQENEHYELFDLADLERFPGINYYSAYKTVKIWDMLPNDLKAYDEAFDKLFAPLMVTQDDPYHQFDPDNAAKGDIYAIGTFLDKFAFKVNDTGEEEILDIGDMLTRYEREMPKNHDTSILRYAKALVVYNIMNNDRDVKVVFRPDKMTKKTPIERDPEELHSEEEYMTNKVRGDYIEIKPLSREYAKSHPEAVTNAVNQQKSYELKKNKELDQKHRENEKKIAEDAKKIQQKIANDNMKTYLQKVASIKKNEQKINEIKAQRDQNAFKAEAEKKQYTKEVKQLNNRIAELEKIKKEVEEKPPEPVKPKEGASPEQIKQYNDQVVQYSKRIEELEKLKKQGVNDINADLDNARKQLALAERKLEKADPDKLKQVQAEMAAQKKLNLEREKKEEEIRKALLNRKDEKKEKKEDKKKSPEKKEEPKPIVQPKKEEKPKPIVQPEKKEEQPKPIIQPEKEEQPEKIERRDSIVIEKEAEIAGKLAKVRDEQRSKLNKAANEYAEVKMTVANRELGNIIKKDNENGNPLGEDIEIKQPAPEQDGDINTIISDDKLKGLQAQLGTKHRFLFTGLHIVGGTSHELQALKDNVEALLNLTKRLKDVPADKAMILRETYVKKLEETVDNYMIKKNKGNPNWKASTKMGEKRYEAAQNLKQFVNEYKERYKLTHAISKPEYNQIVSNELNAAEWQERIKIAVNNGAKPDSEQVQGEKADELIKCVTGYLAAFKLSKLVENNKMTAKEAKDNFVETARNIALSGSFNRLLADAKGSTPWEVALNIQKKAMKNKGAQIYNDYMKISNKMENELKNRPSEVGKKTEIVKQDNSLKKLN